VRENWAAEMQTPSTGAALSDYLVILDKLEIVEKAGAQACIMCEGHRGIVV